MGGSAASGKKKKNLYIELPLHMLQAYIVAVLLPFSRHYCNPRRKERGIRLSAKVINLMRRRIGF